MRTHEGDGPGGSPNRTLHTQVASRLGARIVSGELAAGSTLPNEASLGAELGVSRTVVREAIKVLAAKALLEVRPKTGTKIRPRRHWNMLDPDVLEWGFPGSGTPADLEDLLEVRRLVEPAAARMAAERADRADLAEVEDACSEMESATEDLAASIDPDLRFHLAILDASHNVFMQPFGALIQAALRSSMRVTNASRSAYLRSVRQHRCVLEAIRGGDGEAAESAMQALLESTSGDIHAILGTRRPRRGAGGAKRARSRRRVTKLRRLNAG